MFEPKTFIEFCTAMQTGATVRVNGKSGLINSIEREDGSGRCWIINMTIVAPHTSGPYQTFFREG